MMNDTNSAAQRRRSANMYDRIEEARLRRQSLQAAKPSCDIGQPNRSVRRTSSVAVVASQARFGDADEARMDDAMKELELNAVRAAAAATLTSDASENLTANANVVPAATATEKRPLRSILLVGAIFAAVGAGAAYLLSDQATFERPVVNTAPPAGVQVSQMPVVFVAAPAPPALPAVEATGQVSILEDATYATVCCVPVPLEMPTPDTIANVAATAIVAVPHLGLITPPKVSAPSVEAKPTITALIDGYAVPALVSPLVGAPNPTSPPELASTLPPKPLPRILRVGTPVADNKPDHSGMRLVVHFPAGVGESARISLQQDIAAFGVDVDAIQVSPHTISKAHVRYFFIDDADAAQAMGHEIGIGVRDFTNFRPLPSPGTVEIWMQGSGRTQGAFAQSQRTAPQPAAAPTPAPIFQLADRIADNIANVRTNIRNVVRSISAN